MKTQTLSCKILFFLAACFALPTVRAQKLPMKFGKIEPEYFTMTSYSKDTAADALVLGDFGDVQIQYNQSIGFFLEYTYHFRAKIFKKTAYDLADGSIELYHTTDAKDMISKLQGSVYNMENGKIVESKLEKDMIHDEIIDIRNTEKKFTLPNVREGSIIEYTYTLNSDFFYIPEWYFQGTRPVLWSEFRVMYPEFFVYKMLQKGYLSFNVNENVTKPLSITITDSYRGEMATSKFDYNEKYYRWVINDVPAFREEPYMNATLNYMSSIEFELGSYKPPYGMVKNFTQTWEKITEELLKEEDFGLQLNRGAYLQDFEDMLKAKYSGPEQLMVASYHAIRNHMRWDGRNRVRVTESLRKAYDDKSGSSADINLMLVTLLKHLGLDAEPVIISTRSNGIVHPAQIMLNQFNYVIVSVKIGDKSWLLDATDKLCPPNMLPERCINGQGRVISEKRPGWIDLNTTTRYISTNIVAAKIAPDGSISGNIQNSFSNYAALRKRNEVKGCKDQEEYIRNLEGDNEGFTVQKFELLDVDSVHKPYRENLDFVMADNNMASANLIAFSPMLFDQLKSNPFKLEERKFPVDYIFPRQYKTIITYEIPEGYILDERPKDLTVAMPDGKTKFSYRLALNGRNLQFSCTFDIGTALYTGMDYPTLKEFYNTMVSKQAEKVVLKRAL